MPTTGEVIQLFPEKKQVPLEGLYLRQNLSELPAQVGRPLVLTAYVTDRNGIVANKGKNNSLQVPPEIKNSADWHLFQELMAQSNVVISGSSYLKRFKAAGRRAEDILFQYEPGQEFEQLGQWRLDCGYGKRQPDLAILTRQLDFEFPSGVLGGERKVFIFTTYAMAKSEKAGPFADAGALVVGSGETGVEGQKLMDYLWMDSGYHVAMMATGPSVLDLLLQSNCLDLLYVTEVQREIPFEDPSDIRMILPDGKKVGELGGFTLTHRFLQENMTTEDGTEHSQEFHRFDRKDLQLP